MSEEIRLKRLEFLFNLSETRLGRLSRIANVLMVGNGGAIATSLLLIKDYTARFEMRPLIYATISFVAGLILSGVFGLYSQASETKRREKMYDLLMDGKDIKDAKADFDKETYWTRQKWSCGVSMGFFGLGVILILRALKW